MAIRVLGAVALCGLMLTVGACSWSHSRGEPARPEEGADAAVPDQEAFALRDEGFAAGWVCDTGTNTKIEDDAVAPELGFAPAEVLDFALGDHEAPLRWGTDPQLRLAPETGEGTLEIRIERAGDVVFFEPDSVFTGHGATCTHWYAIPVRVTLRSDGGALDEVFLATLRTKQTDGAFIQVSTEGRALGGALEPLLLADGVELSPSDLMLSLSIAPSGISGTLHAEWTVPPETTVALSLPSPVLAHWGPADCARGQLALELQEPKYGAAARSMVERLTDLVELDVTWMDGSASKASVAFSTDATGTCVSLLQNPTATWSNVTLEGTLQLRSEDGRLDGTYPVEANILGDSLEAPARHQVLVRHETYLSDGPMTPEELGFVRVSVSEVPRPTLSLTLILESGETLGADSAIMLWTNDSVCEPDPAVCSDVFEAAERGTFSR